MSASKKPRAPANLGSKGRAFWRAATAVYEFRVDELVTLEQVCRELDLIDVMEQRLAEAESLVVAGSMGQDAPHPLLGPIHQHRSLLNQQLKALGMVDPVVGSAKRSTQARAAANARWSRGAAAS